MAIETIVGQTVTFTDQSTGLDVSGVTYAWDFGDGSLIDTNKNTSHVYTTKGLYNVTHSVKNACNASPVSCTGQQVTVLSQICGWVKTEGGKSALTIVDVFTITDAFLGFASIGFIPTITHVFGITDVFLGFTPSGEVGECV